MMLSSLPDPAVVLKPFLPAVSPPLNPSNPCMFVGDSLKSWTSPASLECNGLLVRRPFDGKWDSFQQDIDDARTRFGAPQALVSKGSHRSSRLFERSVTNLLAAAALPSPLTQQIHEDACELASVLRSLCPAATDFEVKLEIFGENTCARWHQDHFVGRAIVSYTGQLGTQYTQNANVDFHELKYCGNNDCILRDKQGVESVAVGDLLLIKGTKYPGIGQPGAPANGLVHKSPPKLYDEDGKVVNRLVLKVDIMDAPIEEGGVFERAVRAKAA